MEWIPDTFDLPITDEQGEVVGMKKCLSRYHARFDDQEKMMLRMHLERFPEEKIDQYISSIADACTYYMEFLFQRKNSEIIEIINDTLTNINKAKIKIEYISQQKLPLVQRIKSVPGRFSHETDKTHHFIDPQLNKIAYADVQIHSKHALFHIDALIEALVKIKPEVYRGRPTTEGGFAQAIYDKFLEVFGEKPPLSPYGFFASILMLCLEGMGLEHEDPGRRLKKIKT